MSPVTSGKTLIRLLLAFGELGIGEIWLRNDHWMIEAAMPIITINQVAISIHVYGANIGAVQRSVYETDGTRKTFVSGYSNTELPNLWDRSKEGKPS